MLTTPDEQRPSLEPAEPVAWSVPEAPPVKPPRPPARLWVHFVGALLASTAPALYLVGLLRGDRSMDLPFGDPVRYGLLGNTMPRTWWCSEGHEHRSAPFWLAALVLLAIALVLWRLLARRFPRPGGRPL